MRRSTMRATTAAPASADEGSANAERQTQPTPNRGGTAGGPSHGPGAPPAGAARSGDAGVGGAADGAARPPGRSDGHPH